MHIPYGCQSITADDVEAVSDVLTSDFLTQGPKVPEFEQTVARYCTAQHGVATNSATSALHIACLALSLGEGDRLWTTPNSFVASANCALYCRAEIDFVDIELETGNLCVKALAEKCEHAEREGQLPKIVIPVHFAGQPCDMKEIHALSRRYGFSIIEDASHALGAEYHAERVGGCQYSEITFFSFHPVKMVTTGEGGIALTRCEVLADKMRLLMSHGITRDPECMVGASEGGWYYQQVDLGYNYRLSDLHAALGVSQMGRLDHFVARRNELASHYREALSTIAGQPLTPLSLKADRHSSYHLYVVRLSGRGDLEQTQRMRKKWFDQLRQKGIGVQVHYIPIPNQPFYKALKRARSPETEPPETELTVQLPNMAAYYAGALSLPLYPTLTEAQFSYVIEALNECNRRFY